MFSGICLTHYSPLTCHGSPFKLGGRVLPLLAAAQHSQTQISGKLVGVGGKVVVRNNHPAQVQTQGLFRGETYRAHPAVQQNRRHMLQASLTLLAKVRYTHHWPA